MLQFKHWKTFFLHQFLGSLFFLIPLVLVSILFSVSLQLPEKDFLSWTLHLAKMHPLIVFLTLIKVFALALLLCFALQCLSIGLRFLPKLFFGFVFFSLSCLRMEVLYPNATENHLAENALIKGLITWSPFLLCLVLFILNLMLHVNNMHSQTKKIQKHRYSIDIEFTKQTLRTFSIQGSSLLMLLLVGGVFLSYLTSSFKIILQKNHIRTEKPHVFLFAVDHLSDKVFFDPAFSNVMPLLKARVSQGSVSFPMIMGSDSIFSNWTEIATGQYSIQTSVRNGFPSKLSRMEKKDTLFNAAKKSGYSTFFVSDFSGNLFSRYPFGIDSIQAPTANLESFMENRFLSAAKALQAVLILPNLQSLVPAVLESSAVSDPRLVVHTITDQLSAASRKKNPIFLTALFSADSQKKDLYEKQLNAIDVSLNDLLEQMHSKGWLENAVVVFLGAHDNSVPGITPFVLSPFLKTGKKSCFEWKSPLFRSIDLAPLLEQCLNLEQMKNQQTQHHDAFVPKNRAYYETNPWFPALLDVDPGMDFEFYFHPEDNQALSSRKDRVWITPGDMLFVQNTSAGMHVSLHGKTDVELEKKLQHELNLFLNSNGVDVVFENDNDFFYAENSAQ